MYELNGTLSADELEVILVFDRKIASVTHVFGFFQISSK